MKKRYALFVTSMLLLCLGTMKAQTGTLFMTVPVTADATFGKYSVGTSTVAIGATVASGTDVAPSDALVGTMVQVAPYSGVAFVTTTGIKGNTMFVLYGAGGYVMFRDANGAGIGWHITYSGWTINKVQGSLVMEINLEAPFWLGDPPVSVSPTLIQMKSAWTAKLLLPLQAPKGTTFNDLCFIGSKGQYAQQSIVTLPASGYLYLFR